MSERKVYVVTAKNWDNYDGEWWVCGVYATKDEAIRIADLKEEEDRAANAIYRSRRTVYSDGESEFAKMYPKPEKPEEYEEYLKWHARREVYCRAKCDAAPPFAGNNVYDVIEMPMGVWGKWEPDDFLDGNDEDAGK